MIMDSIQADLENVIVNAEGVKTIVLERLVNEKLLTEEQALEFADKFGVVPIKKKWYNRIFGKKTNNEGWIFKLVNIVD
jgi:hypothetical protein